MLATKTPRGKPSCFSFPPSPSFTPPQFPPTLTLLSQVLNVVLVSLIVVATKSLEKKLNLLVFQKGNRKFLWEPFLKTFFVKKKVVQIAKQSVEM